MRLVRFGPKGKEKPGLMGKDGRRHDASSIVADWDHEFLANRANQPPAGALSEEAIEKLPIVPEGERWGAPIPRPGKVVCIGLNYSDHARESGMPIPAEPILFLKAANTVVGPYDDIQIPRRSHKTDWEVELGVVVGAQARYLESEEEAADCIAGYCVSHDVSEREFQHERGGQWTKGKSCDTFNPIGPWLATKGEIANPAALNMSLRVNGEIRQRGSTATMVFGVNRLIYYISQFMTLEPGDLISTGTPPGVGAGMKPPQFLKAGDVVDLEIERLGTQRQRCVQA
jgi:2,4-diketo-3-deoxy-L-fuconate hydrolase